MVALLETPNLIPCTIPPYRSCAWEQGCCPCSVLTRGCSVTLLVTWYAARESQSAPTGHHGSVSRNTTRYRSWYPVAPRASRSHRKCHHHLLEPKLDHPCNYGLCLHWLLVSAIQDISIPSHVLGIPRNKVPNPRYLIGS